MKIIILTELFDELRANKSFYFENENFASITESFKSKANGIHSFFSFSCDHIILNKPPTLNYKIKRIYNNLHCKTFLLQNTINTYDIDNINFKDYDIIWCRDDILLNPNLLKLKKMYPRKLFIYENVEHAFPIINLNYDLFLDHTNFDFELPNKLNSCVSFPYPCNKDYLRKHIIIKKINTIFFDNRDLLQYSKLLNLPTIDTFKYLKNYFLKINITILCNIFRPEKSFNPHSNNSYDTSTASYFKKNSIM